MGLAPTSTQQALAVLISGGLDSAILLGEGLGNHKAVYPLYIRSGHHWESVELAYLQRYLAALAQPALKGLEILEIPVADLYPGHWSLTGTQVPDDNTPDEAVFLPGRNVLLLAKGILWCHLHDVPAVALGSLGTNPFPDATPAFFAGFESVVNHAIGGAVAIKRPFAALKKKEVMRRGITLPLELTFSCIRPAHGMHCGRCNKCAERRQAFAEAGVKDRTRYAS